ncbi:MAG TPA: TIM barrel protein [Clostridia bacterium]|nr:TIM barrel protein [Clostridia bacterium]
MVLFGPSGNSDIFYEQGYKSSLEMPEWLRNMGLDAYEYSCARGVRIRQDMAEKLGALAVEMGITLSVHAPYYINLASEDPQAIEKSIEYIIDTSKAAEAMGAKRVVLHPGSLGKMTRSAAFSNIKSNLSRALQILKRKGSKVSLCPETLGKKNQMGRLEEILELCRMDEALIPTLDFGHLHAIDGGALKEKKDYERVFDKLFTALGDERGKNIHIHYSKVEYTVKGGEKKHWSFDDIQYGPEFEPLAECLIEYGVSATIISESRGTMAEDSAKIKKIYGRIEQEHLSGPGKSW